MELDYTQLFTAIIAAYIALAGVLYQRRSERQQEEKKRRAEAYKEYTKQFWRSDATNGSVDDYRAALAYVYLTASDEVLRATSEFDRYYNQAENIDYSGQASLLYGRMIHAMRKDASLLPTELSEEQVTEDLRPWQERRETDS